MLKKVLLGDRGRAAAYLPLAHDLLRQAKRLNLMTLRRTLPGVEVVVWVYSWGDHIRINALEEPLVADMYILEDKTHTAIVYGMDVLTGKVKEVNLFVPGTPRVRLAELPLQDYVNPATGLDTTAWTANEIGVAIRSDVADQVRVLIQDTRNDQTGDPIPGLWKGTIGEARLLADKLWYPSWDWSVTPQPHVSSGNHVTKSGLEFRYQSVQTTDGLQTIYTNETCRWYWRDLNAATPEFQELFDLGASGALYQDMPGVPIGSPDVLWLPIRFDIGYSFCATSDTTIYMRCLPWFNGTYFADAPYHEWWTLWRADNGNGTYGAWGLYYDGFWNSLRMDTSVWLFRGFVYGGSETVAGYLETQDIDALGGAGNQHRLYLTTNGNPLSAPTGFFSYDMQALLGVDRTSTPDIVQRAYGWMLEGTNGIGLIFTNSHASATVADGIFLQNDAGLTEIYRPAAGRTLEGTTPYHKRNGRWVFCVEQDRVNPSSATTDALVVDLLAPAGKTVVRRLNRMPGYAMLYGNPIMSPFAFVEPGRL